MSEPKNSSFITAKTVISFGAGVAVGLLVNPTVTAIENITAASEPATRQTLVRSSDLPTYSRQITGAERREMQRAIAAAFVSGKQIGCGKGVAVIARVGDAVYNPPPPGSDNNPGSTQARADILAVMGNGKFEVTTGAKVSLLDDGNDTPVDGSVSLHPTGSKNGHTIHTTVREARAGVDVVIVGRSQVKARFGEAYTACAFGS